jgi:hypothetical protein
MGFGPKYRQLPEHLKEGEELMGLSLLRVRAGEEQLPTQGDSSRILACKESKVQIKLNYSRKISGLKNQS